MQDADAYPEAQTSKRAASSMSCGASAAEACIVRVGVDCLGFPKVERNLTRTHAFVISSG